MSKVLTGARCRVSVYDPASGKSKTIGLFNTVSWGLSYETQPAFILGRYSPADITFTAANEISINCGGYRVIDHGPHVDGAIPKLQDLLNHEYIELTVIDRQSESNGKDGRITKFRQVRPTGYHTSISARGQVEMTCSFVGIRVDDESATNSESPGSTDLP